MRKQFKRKKRSCPMCKPHKMGWKNRWSIDDRRKAKAASEQESLLYLLDGNLGNTSKKCMKAKQCNPADILLYGFTERVINNVKIYS